MRNSRSTYPHHAPTVNGHQPRRDEGAAAQSGGLELTIRGARGNVRAALDTEHVVGVVTTEMFPS